MSVLATTASLSRPTSPSKAAPAKKAAGLRVGVTLFIRDNKQSIWENGIFQNCFFLLMLLDKSPVVDQAFIVNGGPGDPKSTTGLLADAGADAAVMTMDEAMTNLDVIIELSAQLNPEWAKAFKQRGGFIIAMHVANDFVIDGDCMAHNRSPGLLMSGVPYDRIWTLAAFERTCASYYSAGLRAPVRVMQHLWSPIFLERSVAARRDTGQFRYIPGNKRWRLAIMEPNICSVKTCHLPLLACDVAHRLNSQAIQHVRVFCSLDLKDKRNFVAFARSTDLVRQGLATFEGRYPSSDIMGPLADTIVSHHWENGQNYLYYEALHGGFPLIHNSQFLDGCGYRYKDFDPMDAAAALLQAMEVHDRSLDNYRRDARQLLARLDPIAETNIRLYSDAIVGLLTEEVC